MTLYRSSGSGSPRGSPTQGRFLGGSMRQGPYLTVPAHPTHAAHDDPAQAFLRKVCCTEAPLAVSARYRTCCPPLCQPCSLLPSSVPPGLRACYTHLCQPTLSQPRSLLHTSAFASHRLCPLPSCQSRSMTPAFPPALFLATAICQPRFLMLDYLPDSASASLPDSAPTACLPATLPLFCLPPC